MTDALYFVPRTGEIVLSDCSKRVLVKGVRPIDDNIANDPAATAYGVKPIHEMTAAERAAHDLPAAAPDVDEGLKVDPKTDPTPVLIPHKDDGKQSD